MNIKNRELILINKNGKNAKYIFCVHLFFYIVYFILYFIKNILNNIFEKKTYES